MTAGGERCETRDLPYISDLSRKQQRDPIIVLASLYQHDLTYTSFSASGNSTIAKTITELYHKHRWVEPDNRDLGYPNCRAKLTDAGRMQLLAAGYIKPGEWRERDELPARRPHA